MPTEKQIDAVTEVLKEQAHDAAGAKLDDEAARTLAVQVLEASEKASMIPVYRLDDV